MNNNKIKLIALVSFLTLGAGLASCQATILPGNEVKKSYNMDENPVKITFSDITKNDVKIKIEQTNPSIKIMNLYLFEEDNTLKTRDIQMSQTSITDLVPNTNYSILCKYLVNEHGDYYESREWISGTFKTLAGEAKIKINMMEIGIDSARFELESTCEYPSPYIEDFKGELFLKDEKIKDISMYDTINELLPDTEYKLVGKAKYSFSQQESYEAKVETTFKTLAESDFAVKPLITSVNTKEVIYELKDTKYSKVNDRQTSVKIFKDGQIVEDAYVNSGKIGNLEANTTYQLQVETSYYSRRDKIFKSSVTFKTPEAKLPSYIDSLIEFEGFKSTTTEIRAIVSGVKLSKNEYVTIYGGKLFKDGQQVAENENYLNFTSLEPETIYDLEVSYNYHNNDVNIKGIKTYKVATDKNTENHATVVCNDFEHSFDSCRFDFALDSYKGLEGKLNSIKLVSLNGHDLNIDSKTYKGYVLDLNPNDYYTFYIDYDYEDVNGVMHKNEIYRYSFQTVQEKYDRDSVSLNLGLPKATSITAELYAYKKYPNYRVEITKQPLKFYIDGVEQDIHEDPTNANLYTGLKPETTYEVVGRYSYTDPVAKVLVEKELRKTFTTSNTDDQPYFTYSNVTPTTLDFAIKLPKIKNARVYIESTIVRFQYGADITSLFTDQYTCHLENLHYKRYYEIQTYGHICYDNGHVEDFNIKDTFKTQDILNPVI